MNCSLVVIYAKLPQLFFLCNCNICSFHVFIHLFTSSTLNSLHLFGNGLHILCAIDCGSRNFCTLRSFYFFSLFLPANRKTFSVWRECFLGNTLLAVFHFVNLELLFLEARLKADLQLDNDSSIRNKFISLRNSFISID